MSNVFVTSAKPFKLHSGGMSEFKIECDALSDADIATFAKLVSERFLFSNLYGVPRGGTRLADALQRYRNHIGPLLIVDDVLTTGASMNKIREYFGSQATQGVVIFARGTCPDWIKPIFQMW